MEIVEGLREEIEMWQEGMPENLQGSEKHEALEDCKTKLEEIISACQEVEFPRMFS